MAIKNCQNLKITGKNYFEDPMNLYNFVTLCMTIKINSNTKNVTIVTKHSHNKEMNTELCSNSNMQKLICTLSYALSSQLSWPTPYPLYKTCPPPTNALTIALPRNQCITPLLMPYPIPTWILPPILSFWPYPQPTPYSQTPTLHPPTPVEM